MAYPTDSLSRVLEDIDRRMIGLKELAVRRKAEMAAGNVGSMAIVQDLFPSLRKHRAALVTAAATQGIGAYAQQIKNNGTLDVVEEFNAVITAIDNVLNWISANFPKDASGFLLAQTLGAEGPVDRQFTPAQTAGLRTQLDTIISAIN